MKYSRFLLFLSLVLSALLTVHCAFPDEIISSSPFNESPDKAIERLIGGNENNKDVVGNSQAINNAVSAEDLCFNNCPPVVPNDLLDSDKDQFFVRFDILCEFARDQRNTSVFVPEATIFRRLKNHIINSGDKKGSMSYAGESEPLSAAGFDNMEFEQGLNLNDLPAFGEFNYSPLRNWFIVSLANFNQDMLDKTFNSYDNSDLYGDSKDKKKDEFERSIPFPTLIYADGATVNTNGNRVTIIGLAKPNPQLTIQSDQFIVPEEKLLESTQKASFVFDGDQFVSGSGTCQIRSTIVDERNNPVNQIIFQDTFNQLVSEFQQIIPRVQQNVEFEDKKDNKKRY